MISGPSNGPKLYVNGLGLFAPGLHSWAASLAVLSGQVSYRPQPLPAFGPSPLPRNEARRISFTVRLALQVAWEAMTDSLLTGPSAIFACTGGNSEALEKIFATLTLPGRSVSPNQFINSVHNAPLGYWSIAAGARAPGTSLGAYDASFAAGLLEAWSLAVVEERVVLLVAYDVPPPAALRPFRAVTQPFGMALLLSPRPAPESRWRLQVGIGRGQREDRLADAGLETLRNANPAARSLPLLKALAEEVEQTVVVPGTCGSQLLIRCRPC